MSISTVLYCTVPLLLTFTDLAYLVILCDPYGLLPTRLVVSRVDTDLMVCPAASNLPRSILALLYINLHFYYFLFLLLPVHTFPVPHLVVTSTTPLFHLSHLHFCCYSRTNFTTYLRVRQDIPYPACFAYFPFSRSFSCNLPVSDLSG